MLPVGDDPAHGRPLPAPAHARGGGENGGARQHRGGGPAAALRLARGAGADLHRAAGRPAPARRRDLLPRRAPGRDRRRPGDDGAARGAGGDRPGAGAGRADRGAAAGLDLRHRLPRPPLRRPRRPPGRAGPGTQPDRGRDRPHLLARGAARELRDAPPGPPRRPHPHPHLRGGGTADLGRHGPDPRRLTAATSTSSSRCSVPGRCGCRASAPPSRRGRSPSPGRWRPSRR